jgi:hypothetical protein
MQIADAGYQLPVTSYQLPGYQLPGIQNAVTKPVELIILNKKAVPGFLTLVRLLP